ncbi:MAG: sensor domain-containing diguanylate cyclase [Desulfitobacterium sp.]
MLGKIGELIDKIIEDRAKGNSAIAEMTKAKLILKGIYSDKYDNDCSDEPEILEKLIDIRNQWNCKELNKDGCNFKSAFSKGDTEGEVVLDIQSQLSNCNVKVLIFFASSTYNQEKLSYLMEKAFKDCVVFGCSTAGERVNDKLLTNSVVALALNPNIIADAKVEVIENLNKNFDTNRAFTSFSRYYHESTYTMDPNRYVGIVLIDGMSLKEERLMDEIGNLTNISFVGGSAGDYLKFEKTTVYANGKSYNDSAVIALLKMQDRAGFSIINTRSFKALDSVLVANKVNEEAREVIEFNHKPAAQAYADALGISTEEIKEQFFSHPVGLVINEDNILVRSPRQKIGSKIKFSSNILENMEVRLLKSGDIVQETQKVIEEKKQVLGKRLTGILSFDCLSRRLELEQKDRVEEYGEIFKNIPTVGCYTYGEVNIGYMNQTSNMLIFEYEDREQSETQDDYDYVYNNDNQRLAEANRKLEEEVANLRHKLEMATQELKKFNIMLEEDITGRTEREEYIKHLSYHDELTGLYNRRFYEEAIKRLDNVNNLPLSIIIGDVNNLKMTNDTLGHAKGDELLQKSAIALKESCRSDDIIVRFGGDEFVILLPQTSQEKAERIVKRIGECSSKQFVSDFPVSISLGSDTKENTDKSIAEVFNNAENLMYKHKNEFKAHLSRYSEGR